MATFEIKTIDATGADFTTFIAAMAAAVTGHRNPDPWRVEVGAHNMGNGSIVAFNNAPIQGEELFVVNAPSKKHNNTPALTNVARSDVTVDRQIFVREPWCVIKGMRFDAPADMSAARRVIHIENADGDNLVIDGCLGVVESTSGTASFQFISIDGQNKTVTGFVIVNNVLYDRAGSTSQLNAIFIVSTAGGSITVKELSYNSISSEGAGLRGFLIQEVATSTTLIQNFFGNRCSGWAVDYSINGDVEFTSSGFNVSEDATAPGDDALINKSGVTQYVDTNADLHLLDTAAGIGLSTNRSSVPELVTDGDGVTRPAAGGWDPGALQFVIGARPRGRQRRRLRSRRYNTHHQAA